MKKCWKCDWEWQDTRQPPFKEACPECFSYLHACKNCKFYDPNAAGDCRNPDAEPVQNKEGHNFCEEFVMADLDPESGQDLSNRSPAGRDKFLKMFGGSGETKTESEEVKDKLKKFLEG